MTDADRRLVKEIKKSWAAEQQAIAIYEAEVYWSGGASPFVEILAEERGHGDELLTHAREHLRSPFLWEFSNRCAGWVLGSFLQLLPKAWQYPIHAWAERQAADVYGSCLAALEEAARQGRGTSGLHFLKESLVKAQVQERGHAEVFDRLAADLASRKKSLF